MDSLSSQQYLDSFINHEKSLAETPASSFKLERVQCLLKELGDPQERLKVIHVAGSKGKGSVSAIIATILKCAGYRVGLYTSPHMNHRRERIRVLEDKPTPGGESVGADIFPDCISEKELCAGIERIKPAVEGMRARRDSGPLSFFEVYTALALYYFRERHVDFAVLETGLGGRLDATNAVNSMIVVITRISLEHAYILGDTVEKIAEEKAGIIKAKGQKVVLASQCEAARHVLTTRCEMFGIKPIQVGSLARYKGVTQSLDGQTFGLTLGEAEYPNLSLSLVGEHQRDNAATSICAVQCLREEGVIISDEVLREGCRSVFWPGRLEIVQRDPLIILDSAHDPASAKALAKTICEILSGKKVILILGLSQDKNRGEIRAELESIAGKIILTKADHPRAADLEGSVDVVTALKQAQEAAGQTDVILITGSIFVVSESRRYLQAQRKRAQVIT